MDKRKPGMTPEEQSKRFVEDAQKLIDAGELNPIEAEKAFARLTEAARLKKV
jgi:hypothetical protein